MIIRTRVLIKNKVAIMYFNSVLELIKAQMSGLNIVEVTR